MCGIVCYIGSRPALPILLEGLHRLEYRGYDSSGVALFENGTVHTHRAVGKIRELEAGLNGKGWKGSGGIAHTRWATHGRPSLENAHPHSGGTHVELIHNGIIENYQRIREQLARKGHTFRSDTDTEVLAHLVEEFYDGSLEEAVFLALAEVTGAFGIAVLSSREPNRIVVARRGSPLILGIGQDEFLAASDVCALVSYTRDVIYLHDNDVAILGPEGYRIRNLTDRAVTRLSQKVDWDIGAAEKGGFDHFMLKEIHEQPEALENAMRGRLVEKEGVAKLGGLEAAQDDLVNMDRLIIVSCGTSYYAGLLGRYILEFCTDIAVEVELASEFRYRKLNLRKGTIVLAISQSGETADTLAAVAEAQRKGVPVLGLVNVVGSSIARATAAGIYNHAGLEIGVASTKSFLSQMMILYLLALFFGRRHSMSVSEGQQYIRELQAIPDKVRNILSRADEVEAIAEKYSRFRNFLFLGRNLNYPIALEGALKLKEISYLHAEAYAAGEMKHGPIALIDSEFPTVCLAPRDSIREKVVSNIEEIKARNGPVFSIVSCGDDALATLCDDVFEIPPCGELFTPFLTVVPLQLLAYYIASRRGCEIDQPRNLAKSVTVE